MIPQKQTTAIAPMKITYLGLFNERFTYRAEINGHAFDYFTGIGWSEFARQNPDATKYTALNGTETEALFKAQTLRAQNKLSDRLGFARRAFRRNPEEADILECLQSDVEAGRMSFDEFCDTFGYDNDSLKALDTYRACMETAQKLRGFQFPERQES